MFGTAAFLLSFFLIILVIFLMATNHTQASPKDFFMHLLAIVTLYISAFSFGTLVFQIINFNFPDDLMYFSAQSFIDAIRFAIAALIVALPTFIVTSHFVTKSYIADKEKKSLRIRMWLIYFTLFATAVTILVSLMSIVYQFLGGGLTVRFALQVITVLFIAGMIFGYYLYKVKVEKENKKVILGFLFFTYIVSIIFIILAFTYTGSPQTQRSREFDLQRINDLTIITNEVQFYFDQNKRLPDTLSDLKPSYVAISNDPQTQEPYEYAPISEKMYEVCATFNQDRFSPKSETRVKSNYLGDLYFTAGRNCFTQEVQVYKDIPEPIMIR